VTAIVAFLDGKTTLAAVEATLTAERVTNANVPAKMKVKPVAAPTPAPTPAPAPTIPSTALSSPFARAEAAKAQILTVLDTVERDVGDLRSVPIADFEATMLRSGLVDADAIAKLRTIITAYSKPSTRRHVDIGVHVREMLTE
jgi:hypothetical protein